MKNNELKNQLVKLIKTLLHSKEKEECKVICRKIYDIMIKEFDFDFEENQPVKTFFGTALDARSTAMTLLYPVRLKKYLTAVINSLQEREDKRVLYIGTGAFAPFFVFPILLNYRAKFTLLEINSYSTRVLKQVIEKLQLQVHIIDIEQCDAGIYKVDKDYDLVIGGVNDIGMKHEDSFHIQKNIHNQIPNAQFIPKNILLYLKKDDRVEFYDSLTDGIIKGNLRKDCPYPPKEIPLILTKVQVDDKIVLEPEESIITESTYFY